MVNATEDEEQPTAQQHSLLTSEQVTQFICLFIALTASGFGLGTLHFADEKINDCFSYVFFSSLILLDLVVFLGPSSKTRTVSLCFLMPTALISALLLCFCWLDLSETAEWRGKEIQTGGVKIVERVGRDVTYDEFCRQSISLDLEREVFGGILIDRKPLITVVPAESANFEIIEEGRKIRFTSPEFLGRIEIARTYSTDWYAPANQKYEFIDLKPSEITIQKLKRR